MLSHWNFLMTENLFVLRFQLDGLVFNGWADIVERQGYAKTQGIELAAGKN